MRNRLPISDVEYENHSISTLVKRLGDVLTKSLLTGGVPDLNSELLIESFTIRCVAIFHPIIDSQRRLRILIKSLITEAVKHTRLSDSSLP